jgi:uncharacterized membrane protein
MGDNLKISNIGLYILYIIGIISAVVTISQFYDITLDEYIPYITWFVALAIFFVILPQNVGKIFLED